MLLKQVPAWDLFLDIYRDSLLYSGRGYKAGGEQFKQDKMGEKRSELIKVIVIIVGLLAIPVVLKVGVGIYNERSIDNKFKNINTEKLLIGTWKSESQPKGYWLVDTRTYNKDETFSGSLQIEKDITEYSGAYEIQGRKIIHNVKHTGNTGRTSAWDSIKKRLSPYFYRIILVGVYEEKLIELNNDHFVWAEKYPPNYYIRVKEQFK